MKKPADFLEISLKHVGHVSSTLVVLIAMVCLAAGLASVFFGCASTAKEKKTATDGSPAAETQAQAAASAKNDVEDLASLKIQDLSVREEAGQTVVRLKLSKPVARYRHFPLVQPSRIVIDIFGDAKPQAEVQTFRVMTPLVETLRFSYGEGYARLAVDVPETVVPPYTVTAEDGGLRVTIGTQNPKASAKQTLDLVKDGIRVDVKVAEAKPASSENQVGVPAQDNTRGQTKVYTGQKLSLDFKDADIKNVFRLLAEVSGLNIVVTDEVNKKVTVRLVEVPWDQALDLLIDTNGLGKEQTGNIVRISTAAQLKTEKDALAAAQKAKEDLEPLQTAYFNINYAKAKDLEPKIKALQSKRPDAAVVVDERSNTVMIRDIKKVVDNVSTLVAKFDMRTPQVLVESNIIETNPNFSRSLGIQFQFQTGGTLVAGSSPAGPPFTATPGLISPNGLGGIISTFQSRAGGLQNLLSALQAAEIDGNVKIISRPSVVTLNNQPSTIKSQRILRVALPSSTNIASGSGAAAGTAVATQEIPVGVQLIVTPQVSSDGYILVHVLVESSSVAPNATVSNGTANVIPFDTLTRNAEANILIRDGDTIVIGGILKDTAQDSISGVPYLKDLPVLGWLFKSWTTQKSLEELVVFITPRIASAGSENIPTAEELWREQMKKTQGDVPPYVSPSP
jgi:type IV pilus assembly protein PilQ